MLMNEKFAEAKGTANAALAAFQSAIDDLRANNNRACTVAADACKAYFADAEQRSIQLAKRISALKSELSAADQRVADAQKAVVAAAGFDDNDGYAEAQAELSRQEAVQLKLRHQIQALEGTPLPRNEALYQAVVDSEPAVQATINSINCASNELYSFCRDQIYAWEKALETVRYFSGRGVNDLEKVRAHYAGEYQQKAVPDAPLAPSGNVVNMETARYTFGEYHDPNHDRIVEQAKRGIGDGKVVDCDRGALHGPR